MWSKIKTLWKTVGNLPRPLSLFQLIDIGCKIHNPPLPRLWSCHKLSFSSYNFQLTFRSGIIEQRGRTQSVTDMWRLPVKVFKEKVFLISMLRPR